MQQVCPFGGRHATPDREPFGRGFEGPSEILRGGHRQIGNRLTGRGIEHGDDVAPATFDPLSADEQSNRIGHFSPCRRTSTLR